MRPYILGVENKPCIWPIPYKCFWNGDRYSINGELVISGPEKFRSEINVFIDILNDMYSINSRVADTGDQPDLVISEYKDEENCINLNEEGYILNVTDERIDLKAYTGHGVFNGLQTLLHLIVSSPDDSIHGVEITDRPLKSFRGVKLNLPQKENIEWFKRFVNFLAKYKINKIIIDDENNLDSESLKKYIESRHINIIHESTVKNNQDKLIWQLKTKEEFLKEFSIEIKDSKFLGAYITTESETNYRGICEKENIIYEIIRTSCVLWWEGYTCHYSFPEYVMPEPLEQLACKLYPVERDLINASSLPSYNSRNFKTISLRDFYNATLSRVKFRDDDYDLSFMKEASSIYNVLPFRILEGVKDYDEDEAFVISGNLLNKGIRGILVNSRAKSLVFLHTYLLNKTDLIGKEEFEKDSTVEKEDESKQQKGSNADTVCYYVIKYKDGSKEKVAVTYGKTICYWKAGFYGNIKAPDANPVFVGITQFGIPYIICSQEWVNPKPELEIEKIDIEHPSEYLHEGIALFAITAVI